MREIGTVGWIAITVLVLLLIIWIVHSIYNKGYMPDGVFRDAYESMKVGVRGRYDSIFEQPEHLYEKTVGHVYDKGVKLAVEKGLKAEQAHQRNDHDGTLNRTAADAIFTAYMLAELYNHNAPSTKQQTNDFYERAVYRVTNYTPAAIADTNPTHPAPETIIDRAELYNQHIIYNDIREHIRDTRKNLIKNKTTQRKAAANKYYTPRTIRNDPQNVHDIAVTDTLKHKFDLITSKTETITDLPNIKTVINNSDITQEKKDNAITILNIMKKNPVTSLNVFEDDVVKTVWNRIHSKDNENSTKELENSFIDALASGMEKTYEGQYAPVCTIGRVTRVIDSLCLLDNDLEIAKPARTTEMIRNEAFSKAHTILKNALSKSPEMMNYYNGGDEPKDLETFKTNVKEQIADILRNDYKDLRSNSLENIIRDAQAGVDI